MRFFIIIILQVKRYTFIIIFSFDYFAYPLYMCMQGLFENKHCERDY